ncbi:hypothetical protein IWX90DRAFT_37162 [Phyllosticta citrichinensis]|uniref:FHA domain-containing protein n=1 Tax=Phyllosticta citrichinensis TaxID=1130410 RepID=A0ABR1Y7T8_9PEZI
MNLTPSTTLQVKLTALNDGDPIRERTVRLSVDDPLTIGRASSNRGVVASHGNTKIDNKVISKEHASIRTDTAGERVFLKDLKSMHGTKVDGVVVPRGGEVIVASGASLEFGVSVIRGSESYKPAMYRLEYRNWDPFNTPGPSEHEPVVDYSDIKRGYTDEVSIYSDEEEDCHIVIPDTYLNMKDEGEDEEKSSLFDGIHFEDDSSISEGAPEEEMDYPEESEVEEDADDDSDSGSSDSAYYGPLPRSTTPPGEPDEVQTRLGTVKRFQNKINDLLDQPGFMDTTLEIEEYVEEHVEDQRSKAVDQPLPEVACDKPAASEAVSAVDCHVSRPSQEDIVDVDQKVENLTAEDVHQQMENLIAKAYADVAKAHESTGHKPTGPRPQKRTVEQAELDDIDPPQDNQTKDDDKEITSSPADSPRKRTTAQFLRCVARDTSIFAAGGLAMFLGLAKLPDSLGP